MFNYNIYKTGYTKKREFPEWECPLCNKGVLKYYEPSFTVLKSVDSVLNSTNEFWSPMYDKNSFAVLLICTDSNCRHTVLCTGIIEFNDTIYKDDETDNFYTEIEEVLKPRYFNPSLNFFPIIKKIPHIIKNDILLLFNLFWHDTNSCANKIQTIINLILDKLNIPSTYSENGITYKCNLSKRLEFLKEVNNEMTELILSNYWILKDSRYNLNISRSDLFNAILHLEKIINMAISSFPDFKDELNF